TCWRCVLGLCSRQDLGNGLGAAVHKGNGPADVRHVLPVRVDAQGAAGGGEQVGDGDGAGVLDLRAVGAGRAVGLAAADAAAGEDRRPRVGIVVAPLLRVDA